MRPGHAGTPPRAHAHPTPHGSGLRGAVLRAYRAAETAPGGIGVRIVMFYHSLISDWNHGNAHFLRGVVSELQSRGHSVSVLEPSDAWSREQLVREHGPDAIEAFYRAYPELRSRQYRVDELDVDRE